MAKLPKIPFEGLTQTARLCSNIGCAENELRDRVKRESIIAENNKIRSLPELIDKMKGQVPNGVHMIIDEGALSLVSLKFDVVTKIKYSLRVTSDKIQKN